MRIQFMSQILGDYREKRKAHLHFVPYYLEKLGHKIDIINRKQWPYFYWRYLMFKPDVLVVSGLIGALPIFLKKIGLIRRPVIYYWGDYFHEVMGKKWGADKCAFLEFFCAKNATFITTPSIFLKTICDLFNFNSEYVPHGVIKGINKIEKNPLNELSAEQKKSLKFICIGDIAKYKKTDPIIKAVKRKKCVLYLIGKVFDREIINNLPKNVIYLQEMPHEKVLSYVAACDVAVITADQDSALKMFEYIAMKKPILAFNGRINYVLTHGENAYLTSDFGKAIDKFSSNKILLKKLKKNVAKLKVKTWEEIAEEYVQLFKFLKKS